MNYHKSFQDQVRPILSLMTKSRLCLDYPSKIGISKHALGQAQCDEEVQRILKDARECAKFATHKLEDLTNIFVDANQQAFLHDPHHVPMHSWISHFLQYTDTSSVVYALMLIELLQEKAKLDPTEPYLPLVATFNCHRIFFIAIMLAHKYLYDESYANQAWTQIALNYWTLQEVNAFELTFLRVLDWNVMIPVETFFAYLQDEVSTF